MCTNMCSCITPSTTRVTSEDMEDIKQLLVGLAGDVNQLKKEFFSFKDLPQDGKNKGDGMASQSPASPPQHEMMLLPQEVEPGCRQR